MKWTYEKANKAINDAWYSDTQIEMFGTVAIDVTLVIFADPKVNCFIEIADTEHVFVDHIFKCKKITEDIEATKKLLENKWKELYKEEVSKLMAIVDDNDM
jgi:hypothetical protein